MSHARCYGFGATQRSLLQCIYGLSHCVGQLSVGPLVRLLGRRGAAIFGAVTGVVRRWSDDRALLKLTWEIVKIHGFS